MRLLLDTHAFIWWFGAQDKLSTHVLNLCQDPDNNLFLSITSIWEMQIKLQLGKLTLAKSLGAVIEDEQRVNQLEIMAIALEHVLALEKLPLYHKDPFDRLLIAQAIAEDVTLISGDHQLTRYPIKVIW